MKIIPMNPDLLVIAKTYLEKLETMTPTERVIFTDMLRLYIYPKYVFDKLVEVNTGDSCIVATGHEMEKICHFHDTCKHCGYSVRNKAQRKYEKSTD